VRTDSLEKVLEKLATTDKTTLVCEKAPEGPQPHGAFGGSNYRYS